jgi:hypothetical protein
MGENLLGRNQYEYAIAAQDANSKALATNEHESAKE